MAIEIGGVALDTFAAASHGGEDELAVARRVVAGGATLGGMDLSGANVRRGDGAVAANTVGCERRRCHVFLDLRVMVVVVAVEIAGMTLGAGAARPTIDRGVTVAIEANDPGAVGIGVAEETTVVMDYADRVTEVALVDTERGGGDLRRVVMTMARGVGVLIRIGIGEVVCPVATDTL